MNIKNFKSQGFTLLEILIALFVFSILSLVLASGLRSVIRTEAGVEANALRLRDMQMALLLLSRDLEQTVNRGVTDPKGEEEEAFIGTPRSFVFTHLGAAGGLTLDKPGMQRARYHWEGTTLWRAGWAALDQPPQAKPQLRPILKGVNEARFQYLDGEGRFHDNWPVEGKENQILPQAVSVNFTMQNWGKIRQLYVISANRFQKQQPPSQ